MQCRSHTGPVPAHGACSLPAHTAQALDCSAWIHQRPALGCLHLPGLSRSGSGTWAVLRGTDSVGPAFCALPRSKQLRQERQDIYLSFNDEVFGECGCCNLSPPRCSVLWSCDCPLLALAACHRRGTVCSRLSLYSPLFRARAWRCLRLGLAFRVVDIPQSGLLDQIISLR